MKSDYPQPRHVDALRKLWKEAFGDDDAFLDAFFRHGFSPDRCRCMLENDTVTAVIYWFEVTCRGQRLAYLYAVATASAYRGRGLFSALLEDVKQVLTEDGYDGILLVPETAQLSRIYEKFGFTACTTVSHVEVAAGEKPIAFRQLDADAFAALRREMLPEGGVLQEGAMLDFLATQCCFWAGEGWLAAGALQGDELICQEFLGDRAAMAGLVRALNGTQGRFRTTGDTQPFGWILPLRAHCERPSYFALALDE